MHNANIYSADNPNENYQSDFELKCEEDNYPTSLMMMSITGKFVQKVSDLTGSVGGEFLLLTMSLALIGQRDKIFSVLKMLITT